MENYRRQRRRRRRNEKNDVKKILTAIRRDLARAPNYRQLRFYRAKRCDNEGTKAIFRKATRQILKKGERLIKKILKKDPATNDIFLEVNKIDVQIRWSLNKATIMTFGHSTDRSQLKINKSQKN